MTAKYKAGDTVRVKSSWSGKGQGTGTVVTSGDSGCGVQMDRDPGGDRAHFYDSELTKVNKRR